MISSNDKLLWCSVECLFAVRAKEIAHRLELNFTLFIPQQTLLSFIKRFRWNLDLENFGLIAIFECKRMANDWQVVACFGFDWREVGHFCVSV